MKNYFVQSVICIVLLLASSLSANSQGIYQFWGATSYGGPDDRGVIFTTKADGSGQKVKKYFTANNPGVVDDRNKAVQYNNKLYTVMSEGGLHNEGIISEYDLATGIYKKSADFFSHDIAKASLGLTVYNGKMYSVSQLGGDNFGGTLYEFDPATGDIIIRHHFEGNTGREPMVELAVYNNKLYGMTNKGGANAKGVIYEFNPATNDYNVLVHMTDYYVHNTPFTVFQNKLWSSGTHTLDISWHSIFSFDPATNIIEYKQSLQTIGATSHHGEFAVLNNKFYGMTEAGGIHGDGLIFQYDPITNQLTKEYDLQHLVTAEGSISMKVYNGLLYGASKIGGPNNLGVLFQYNPATNQYNNRVIFSNGNGGKSTSTLCVYNDRMYLWTYQELASLTSKGEFKEYNPIINSYTSLLSLHSSEFRFPIGETVYLNHKIYGIAYLGGDNNNGGIYEYDPATELYTIKVNFPETISNYERASLSIIQGKIYGTIALPAPMGGMIYEYEPGSNTITELYSFTEAQGVAPAGNLSLYNGKLYGVTNKGGNLDWGTIFEYNPQTNVFTTKVNFDSTRGSSPASGLTLYNNKFYGVAISGGANDNGTLYEYNPTINGFAKKVDFEINSSGSNPESGLVVYNNKLYGTTSNGSIPLNGSIYAYDANTEMLTILSPQNQSIGNHTIQRLTIMNDKLYASATAGGLERFGGALFEFDPGINVITKKSDFIGENGRLPRYNKLLPIPALTAPGTLNDCATSNSVNINTTNADTWVAFTDAEGRAVAEIHANGNILGNTAVNFYVNDNAVRQNGANLFYLDRNISFRTENQPQSPVMIRLYIRKAEFEALKAATGGTMEITGLSIYQNNDLCVSEMLSTPTALTTHKAAWATDYVLTASVDSLTSFYFANLDRVLPIRLISFTGKKEAEKNLLSWKLTCTNDVQFSLERSSNGQSFTSIGSLDATQQQCSAVFNYYDSLPLPGINYYRLRITENNGTIHYSNIVSIERSEFVQDKLSIFPNPMQGSTLQINLNVSRPGSKASLTIYDVAGRKIAVQDFSVQAGINRIQMKLGNLTSGVYSLVYSSGQQKISTRFVK